MVIWLLKESLSRIAILVLLVIIFLVTIISLFLDPIIYVFKKIYDLIFNDNNRDSSDE